jgi:hypothetical protein
VTLSRFYHSYIQDLFPKKNVKGLMKKEIVAYKTNNVRNKPRLYMAYERKSCIYRCLGELFVNCQTRIHVANSRKKKYKWLIMCRKRQEMEENFGKN